MLGFAGFFEDENENEEEDEAAFGYKLAPIGLAAGPPDHRNGGFGLPGMRARARAIHAELNHRTAPDAGTTVELIVPHV